MIRNVTLTSRSLLTKSLDAELCIIGGGMAGTCAAITAARQGVKTVLIQDRPVLGGNASSEVRLWILGATSHLGNNNRWARESGVINEILVENVYRNPEGNPIILDMILLEMVNKEPNITLLLNTAVYDLIKGGGNKIECVKGFCSQNSTNYIVHSLYFCDASGDGIVGFLAGAAFRMGAENKIEFNEPMAPNAEYGELLGHSLYFYSKDTGTPVTFIAPEFALDVKKYIPRYKDFDVNAHGCKLWWVEYGGRLDTVHDSEGIKWELWRIIYGVWDYIKNSGKFPQAENYTLEWVGTIPGKRESRRFEGDYMLSQSDIIQQKKHKDVVAFGGWAIDLHPADAIFSEKEPCNQWHSKGIFEIPYRCLYSKNIPNLFLAGRIISVSHVAFGATRVMATSAYIAQVIGSAAALCKQLNKNPAALYHDKHISSLQQLLMQNDQFLPNHSLIDKHDLVHKAQISASSALRFDGFNKQDLIYKPLNISAAQLIPFKIGRLPRFKIKLITETDSNLVVELRASSRIPGFTPDKILKTLNIPLSTGTKEIEFDFDFDLDREQYLFICFLKNESVKISYSNQRLTGIVSVFNGKNKAVSNNGKQVASKDSGVDSFEFWCPQRRPNGQNLALTWSHQLLAFEPENIANGVDRPTYRVNAWVADLKDLDPSITLTWKKFTKINNIKLLFDTDWDHPMESVLMTHPEKVMPFCIRNYSIEDENGNVILTKNNNYQTINDIKFEREIEVKMLKIKFQHPSGLIPAAVYSIRCY